MINNKSTGIKDTNYNFSEATGTDPELLKRSTFLRKNAHATAFDAGLCIPIYLEEVLPNDTIEMEMDMALRLQTLAVAPYDNLDVDVYWFYAPNRLLWDGWKQFTGESKSEWLDPSPLRTPVLKFPQITDIGDLKNTVYDYFGLPVTDEIVADSTKLEITKLPFNFYGKIWNDWFRDTNYQKEELVDFSNTDATFNKDNGQLGGKPLPANKYHDYFSSCLPSPQRGENVSLLDGLSKLEVFTGELNPALVNNPQLTFTELQWARTDKQNFPLDEILPIGTVEGNGLQFSRRTATMEGAHGAERHPVVPVNLGVNLTLPGQNSLLINKLQIEGMRKSIAKQHVLEVSARCGNRYQNFLLGFFGISADNIETGRVELLGIQHKTLEISQVVQTSGTQANGTPQGNISAISLSNMDTNFAFTKSFTEHGWVMAIAVARYNHSYCQGVDKKWTRYRFEDFYLPQYANVGDVPVKMYEIFSSKGNTPNTSFTEEVPGENWGYQEYGAEYKYAKNQVTGAMRPNIEGNMSPWTWADVYAQKPTLSNEWLKEDNTNINRSLSIKPTVNVPQLFGNFYFVNRHTRCMPVHSVPGLEKL